jgi:hypothetical protein
VGFACAVTLAVGALGFEAADRVVELLQAAPVDRTVRAQALAMILVLMFTAGHCRGECRLLARR